MSLCLRTRGIVRRSEHGLEFDALRTTLHASQPTWIPPEPGACAGRLVGVAADQCILLTPISILLTPMDAPELGALGALCGDAEPESGPGGGPGALNIPERVRSKGPSSSMILHSTDLRFSHRFPTTVIAPERGLGVITTSVYALYTRVLSVRLVARCGHDACNAAIILVTPSGSCSGKKSL